MFMKSITAAVALGFIVTVPGASFAADTVHENASYPYGVAPVYPYNPAPAYASPGLEYGYMDTQSYGSIGASAVGFAPAYRNSGR